MWVFTVHIKKIINNEKSQKEEKLAGQAIFTNQKNRPPPSLAQGLDPPLHSMGTLLLR